jgi:hypothetical protein
MNFLTEELELRQQLDDYVMQIIEERCILGIGAIRPGILATYVYQKLGFKGVPRGHFCTYLKNLLQSKGYVYTSCKGKPMVRAISFRGIVDWRYPMKEDNTLQNYQRTQNGTNNL